MRAWIDTGHLNADSGAVGGGKVEVKRNDLLADYVERLCRFQTWAVGSTDEKDANTTLSERYLKANAFKADVFVSIHHDWVKGEQAVIFPRNHDVVASRRLADSINDCIDVDGDGIPNGGIYADRRGLTILKGTDMPAVIVEAARVQDPYIVRKMGRAIVRGICRYKKIAFKDPNNVSLSKGSHGKLVLLLKKELVKRGYEGINLESDKFGVGTEKAVKKFKIARKICSADSPTAGIAGKKTWLALGY